MIFFFNDPPTTEIYTLSLHDALPISRSRDAGAAAARQARRLHGRPQDDVLRSEEHTSELQSRQYLVCRLLLEKKKQTAENEKNNFDEIRFTDDKAVCPCCV